MASRYPPKARVGHMPMRWAYVQSAGRPCQGPAAGAATMDRPLALALEDRAGGGLVGDQAVEQAALQRRRDRRKLRGADGGADGQAAGGYLQGYAGQPAVGS